MSHSTLDSISKGETLQTDRPSVVNSHFSNRWSGDPSPDRTRLAGRRQEFTMPVFQTSAVTLSLTHPPRAIRSEEHHDDS